MIVEPRGAFTCGHQHSQFRPILVRFVHYYTLCWVPERFARLTIPGVHLLVRLQHSQFWPILTRFVDYYSPFWGPEAISTVVQPQGALTCQSSTLAVLADSDAFRGLLLTILGSWSDFHD